MNCAYFEILLRLHQIILLLRIGLAVRRLWRLAPTVGLESVKSRNTLLLMVPRLFYLVRILCLLLLWWWGGRCRLCHEEIVLLLLYLFVNRSLELKLVLGCSWFANVTAMELILNLHVLLLDVVESPELTHLSFLRCYTCIDTSERIPSCRIAWIGAAALL